MAHDDDIEVNVVTNTGWTFEDEAYQRNSNWQPIWKRDDPFDGLGFQLTNLEYGQVIVPAPWPSRLRLVDRAASIDRAQWWRFEKLDDSIVATASQCTPDRTMAVQSVCK